MYRSLAAFYFILLLYYIFIVSTSIFTRKKMFFFYCFSTLHHNTANRFTTQRYKYITRITLEDVRFNTLFIYFFFYFPLALLNTKNILLCLQFTTCLWSTIRQSEMKALNKTKNKLFESLLFNSYHRTSTHLKTFSKHRCHRQEQWTNFMKTNKIHFLLFINI